MTSAEFGEMFGNAAQRFRVGVRLEGNRFVDTTSELMHEEVTRPTLLLLSDASLKEVDDLYRKAHDRLLSNDPAGAITAAVSALEEMLRQLGASGAQLGDLAQAARSQGFVGPGVYQQIIRMNAFRDESDAHTAGTEDAEVARLVINTTGGLLLYLGRSLDPS